MTGESSTGRDRRWVRWFSVRSGQRALETDVSAELDAHVALAVEHLVHQGYDERDAIRLARERFGDFDRARRVLYRSAQNRETRLRWRNRLEDMKRDIVLAMRQASRAPVLFLSLVLTLALGIGANAAVFSIVRATLLQPLPYDEPDRLAMIWRSMAVIPPSESPRIQAALRRGGLTPTHVLEWRSASGDMLDDIAGIQSQGSLDAQFDLTFSDHAERLRGAFVTPNFFDLIGTPAAVGRLFSAADETSGERLVVLSHALWRRGFGSDSSIIGRTVSFVGGRPRQPRSFTVVGVLPPSFRFTYPRQIEAWAMLPWADVRRLEPRELSFNAIGRIRRDRTFEQAVSASRALRDPFEPPNIPREYRKVPHLEPVREWIVGETRPSLLLLAGVSALLLTMTCATVANALLARVAERQRELAVRSSLGADRGRLAGQLLTEGGLLAMTGTLAGIALALMAQPMIRAFLPEAVPRVGELGFDVSMLAFAAIIAGVTTILAALAPSWTGSRTEAGSTLRIGAGASASRRAIRWRQALVSFQSAIATSLLIGAGLLLVSFWRMSRVPLGFEGDQVVTVEMRLLGNRYRQREARSAFQQELFDRVRAIPGVAEVGLTSAVPFRGVDFYLAPEGPDSTRRYTGNGRYVDPGFFSVLRIPLRQGRLLTAADRMGAPRVVVVSESWVKRAFGDQNPLGQFIDLDGPVEIVGVVGDVRYTRLDEAAGPAIYVPRAQSPSELICLVIRTTVPVATVAPLIHRAVREIDPTLPAMELTTVDRIVQASISDRRFYTVATATFAGLALLLTIAGLAIVVARVVTERKREFAIRSALGAGAARLVGEAARSGLRAVAVGVGAGVLIAYASAGLFSRFLFEIPARSVTGYMAAGLVMLAVAIVAAAIPASRALGIPLSATLRAD
jgi:putative ABC transport system permease protein